MSTRFVKSAIITTPLGNTFEVPEGSPSRDAEFAVEHEQTVTYMEESGFEDNVPFHAVTILQVDNATEEYERADPYGCIDDSNCVQYFSGTVVTEDFGPDNVYADLGFVEFSDDVLTITFDGQQYEVPKGTSGNMTYYGDYAFEEYPFFVTSAWTTYSANLFTKLPGTYSLKIEYCPNDAPKDSMSNEKGNVITNEKSVPITVKTTEDK